MFVHLQLKSFDLCPRISKTRSFFGDAIFWAMLFNALIITLVTRAIFLISSIVASINSPKERVTAGQIPNEMNG